MPFDHKKLGKESQDSMWTSYSDLFLGLSVVFLLLYVSASLKQGTEGFQKQQEYKELTKINQDLKEQIKVYDSLKKNYLETQASEGEKETYQKLMAQLDLLQDESQKEKNELMKQAKQLNDKEVALNQYQQIVRNIINSNVLSKSRIKQRDTLIDKKEVVIDQKNVEISSLGQQIAEKKKELEEGKAVAQKLESSLNQSMSELQKAYKKQKLTQKKFLAQKQKLQNEFSAKIEALNAANQEAAAELNQLNQNLQQTKGQLSKTAQELEAAGQNINELKGKYAGAVGQAKEMSGKYEQANQKVSQLSEDLARAQENLNAKKKLAEGIKSAFAAKGISAQVDEKSGDVLLSFGEEYFDTGRAVLKPGMKKVLEKTVPEYSKSLFQNRAIASKISNIEIIGFASPTYKGKFIDPTKLSPEDRGAVNFNLDLSYQRARSIFDHVYSNMTFEHKKEMLPLIKVAGRSFLANKDRNVATSGTEDFCAKNDCSKLQKVIIKFNLKD
ncbi:microtubule-binding protein [bacterium]|nr:microtubule-binding protein [bacterium]